MQVELAHITDVHLPTPAVRLRELLGKRVLGWLSWRLRRWRVHRPEVLERVMTDVRTQCGGQARLLLTGDLVNIATRAEFVKACCWLRKVATPPQLMFIPGNHDYYVRDALAAGLPWLTPWMNGVQSAEKTPHLPQFPIVRYVRNVALIGLNSAWPAPWREASGRLEEAQLQRLEEVLRDCATKGFCRVVMVHHPPLPALGADKPRKALKNAAALEEILLRAGAELVLFGHTHRWAHEQRVLQGGGLMHVLSAPSASMKPGHATPAAGWQHIIISRQDRCWRMEVMRREITDAGDMRVREKLLLSSMADDMQADEHMHG